MRLRRLAFAAGGVVAAVLLGAGGGCRALVGDDLIYESGAGGNGGSTSTTDTSATNSTSDATTDATSTGTTSSGEAGGYEGPPCTTTTLANCALPPDSDTRWQFQGPCPNGPWCVYADAPGSGLQQEGGEMVIESTPAPNGTGWYNVTDRDFAPLLFRSTDVGARFVVVTRVTVSGSNYDPPTGTSNFKAAGILIRQSDQAPDYPTEAFYKLEYGYMGNSPHGGDDFGVLAASNFSGTANHWALEEFGRDVEDVGLAVCRLADGLDFFYDDGGGWTNLVTLGGAGTMWGTAFSMGLFTGTFNPGGQLTTGEFAYYGVRLDEALDGFASCQAAIEDFDAALIAGETND